MDNRKYIIQSLDTALKILDILSAKSNIGLTEIAKIAKISKSSAFKMLSTLERRNYVAKTHELKYVLGPKFFYFRSEMDERYNLSKTASVKMLELRQLTKESIYLGVLNKNGRVIIISRESGKEPNYVDTRIAFEMELHTNAMGKSLLAFQDEKTMKDLLKMIKFKKYTDKTIKSRSQLLDEIKIIKEKGFSLDKDERYLGHSGIAAPIYNKDGICVAAISLVVKTPAFSEKRKEFAPLLIEYANQISSLLKFLG